MATRRSPPSLGIPNKRRRLSKIDDQRINEVAFKAAEVLLPWDEVSPLYFSEWLEKFSNAQRGNEGTYVHVDPSNSFVPSWSL